jgi:hypothetical protein
MVELSLFFPNTYISPMILLVSSVSQSPQIHFHLYPSASRAARDTLKMQQLNGMELSFSSVIREFLVISFRFQTRSKPSSAEGAISSLRFWQAARRKSPSPDHPVAPLVNRNDIHSFGHRRSYTPTHYPLVHSLSSPLLPHIVNTFYLILPFHLPTKRVARRDVRYEIPFFCNSSSLF